MLKITSENYDPELKKSRHVKKDISLGCIALITEDKVKIESAYQALSFTRW